MTKANGTRLGLSLCDTIVREHGGTLDVWSEPGRGTRFTVVFPRAEGAVK
jgi:signal transduction histidine kinase